MSNNYDREKKSSAVTLSDMELFVFPELIYSLVLANIMSPCIWEWRTDPWFRNIENMNPYKRVLRLKQYIMDNYIFNLDLETWGLTTRDREIARFKYFIDTDALKQSNALFGYEGDKYFFAVDLRKHFGLDKYDGSVIPYWKTETVEAMNAFRHKENYETGAGECVSLATLYAAALFVVARIPLSDIYLMATPLHSQNFIDVRDGLLTNNRRLVTKNMWINGTELSAKARRALENERVTIMAHETGHIHILFPEATINPDVYRTFVAKLTAFVKTPLTAEALGNFIRYRRDLQKCFQVRWNIHGHDYYIDAERVFSYETNSPHLFTSQNRKFLMNDIEIDEFRPAPLPSRIVINDLETYVRNHVINFESKADIERLHNAFASDCFNASIAIDALIKFCIVQPRIPRESEKTFTSYAESLGITLDMNREDIISRLVSIRAKNTVADLTFYAYRDLRKTDVEPFLLAAFTRNPVAREALKAHSIEEATSLIQSFANESIYPEVGRIAQPDEVWNYKRGDGVEKALLLATILCEKMPEVEPTINVTPTTATVKYSNKKIEFSSTKELPEQVWEPRALYTDIAG